MMTRQKTTVAPTAAIAKYRMAASILSRGLGSANGVVVTLIDGRTDCVYVYGEKRVVGEEGGRLCRSVPVVANTLLC